MPSKFEVDGELIGAVFLQVASSKELGALKGLHDNTELREFGALGFYDFAYIFETDRISDEKFHLPPPNTHASDAVFCYKFRVDQYSSPPNLSSWFDDSRPVKSFIFLEVEKLLYSNDLLAEAGLGASAQIIRHIFESYKITDEEVAFFGGFGRSEICALIQTETYQQLWGFLRYIRDLKCKTCFPEIQTDSRFPVLINTTSIPLISSRQERDISEALHADITYRCMAGFEHVVKSYFPSSEGFQVRGVWGSHDVHVSTKKCLPVKDILKRVDNCRDAFTKLNAQVRSQTMFSLLDRRKYDIPLHYRVEIPQEYKKDLNIPEFIGQTNHLLKSRLKVLSDKRKLYLNTYTHQINVRGLTNFCGYLQYTIDNLSSKNETKLDGLFEAVENAEIALSQKVSSRFSSENSEPHLPFVFGDGIFTSLSAVDVLVGDIYDQWHKSGGHAKIQDGLKPEWVGFTIFSESSGFKLRYGEVLFLPFSSLCHPSSDSGNWLTLTHEISHSIYYKLNMHEEYKDIFQEAASNAHASRMHPTDASFINEIFELFAHWYDFVHFYNQRIDVYLTSIWRSWSVLGSFKDSYLEYIFRSYSISVASDYEEFEKKTVEQEAYDSLPLDKRVENGPLFDYLDKRWELHKSELRSLWFLNKELLEQNLTEDSWFHIKEVFMNFHSIFTLFEKCCRDEEFKELVNKPYKNLDEHIEFIKQGKVILDKIENPYILVKKVIQSFGENGHDGADQSIMSNSDLSLILSLKNQVRCYYPVKNEGEEDAESNPPK
jgi:hypothetical protein